MKMETNLFTTLQECIDFVKENREETAGCICPCCGQLSKVYRRKINSGMARELIRLYWLNRQQMDKYFHIRKFATVSGGEISKLVHWDLVEQQEKDLLEEKQSKTSGYWRITEKGKLFVKNQLLLPSYITMYNNTFLGFIKGNQTNIVESLGNKFSYGDLMNNI